MAKSQAIGRGILAALVSIAFASPLAAAEKWHILQVDNIELLSNARERDLKEFHRDVFYFNRSMEYMFGKRLTRPDDSIQAIAVRSERELANFIGKRAESVSGVYSDSFGIAMILMRNQRNYANSRRILFHLLTHRNIEPMNPPAWFNEGVAGLLTTLTPRTRDVLVGTPSAGWVDYHRNAPKIYVINLKDFFAVNYNCDHYTEGEKTTYFYGMAWLLAHYCWFGEPSLKPGYLALGREPTIDNNTLTRHLGFGFDELKHRLESYKQSGRYTYYKLKMSDMPPLPEPSIREATETERMNFFARAMMLNKDFSRARGYLSQLPDDDLMAAESLAVISLAEKEGAMANQYLEQAVKLGTKNRILLTVAAQNRLRDSVTRGVDGSFSLEPAVAREILMTLKPALRMHYKYPQAVRTMILVFDVAGAAAPENLFPMMDSWDAKWGESDPAVRQALERVRQRSEVAKAE